MTADGWVELLATLRSARRFNEQLPHIDRISIKVEDLQWLVDQVPVEVRAVLEEW